MGGNSRLLHRHDRHAPAHGPPLPPSLSIRLTLLSAGLLNLGRLSVSHKSVVWLKLLHGLGGIVEEGKAGALATTELCPEAEDRDLVLGGLVKLRELLAELILGHVGARWVKDVTVGGAVLVAGPGMACEAQCAAEDRGIRTRPSACVPAVGCG